MIPLSASGTSEGIVEPILGRVTFDIVNAADRGDYVRVLQTLSADEDLEGYVAVIVEAQTPIPGVPMVHNVSTAHLKTGDIVSLDARGYVRTLARRGSAHNAIFATDRCNSLCLMCSQPPKHVDDQWRVYQHLRLIELLDTDTRELGITGGEPTLLKDGLVEIVAKCKERLPQTSLHILSNGRLFYYRAFAERLAAVGHPDLMIGVPIYSDSNTEHDYIVQAKGAFDETLIGLHHLGAVGVPVEIRVIVHSLTAERLPQIAEYIYRNLTFASHVTFMGLELMGLAIPNLDLLWVDPWDYREKLAEATLHLAARGMSVSVYNHQLCTVPDAIWPYCRQSISDWKNDYLAVCDACAVRDRCGGFFTSVLNRRYSEHIRPMCLGTLPDSK
jgi:His-Xaa-Ser system radical SAM maturase HxsC